MKSFPKLGAAFWVALLQVAAALVQGSGYGQPDYGTWVHPAPTSVRPVDVMSDVVNDLGIRILQQYVDEGNVAFSPAGIGFVLAALYEGSSGRGSQQIAVALGLPRDRDVTRIGLRDIHRRLRSYINADGFLGGLTLNRENTKLRPVYEDILRFYGFDFTDDQVETNATTPNPGGTTTSTDDGNPMSTVQPLAPETTTMSSTEAMPADPGSADEDEDDGTSTEDPEDVQPEENPENPVPPPDVEILRKAPTTVDPTQRLTNMATDTTTNPPTSTRVMDGATEASSSSPMELTTTTSSPITTSGPSVRVATTISEMDLEMSTVSVDTLNQSTTSETSSSSPMEQTTTTSSPITTSGPSVRVATTISEMDLEMSTVSVDTLNQSTTSEASSSSPMEQTTTTSSPITTSGPSVRIVTTISEMDLEMSTASVNTVTSESTSSMTEQTISGSDGPDSGTIVAGLTRMASPGTTVISETTTVRSGDGTTLGSTEIPTITPGVRSSEIVVNTVTPISTTQKPVEISTILENTEAVTVKSLAMSPSMEMRMDTTLEDGVASTLGPTSTSRSASTTITSTSGTENGLNPTEPATTTEDPVMRSLLGGSTVQGTTLRPETRGAAGGGRAGETTTVASDGTTIENNSTRMISDGTTVDRTGTMMEVISTTMETIGTTTETTGTTMETIGTTTGTIGTTTGTTGTTMEATTTTMETTGTTTETTGTTTETTGTTTVPTTRTDSANQPRKRSARSPRGYFSNYPDDGFWMQDLGIWRSYAPGTGDGVVRDSTEMMFLVDGCDVTPVTAATYTALLPFAYLPSLQALALEFPLDDPRYNILLLLPTERADARRLAADLSSKTLRLIRQELQPCWVRATIPSFTLRGFVTLTPFLQRMGIRDVFEPRLADLSLMTPDLGVYARDVQQSIGVNIRNYMQPDRTHSRNGLFERAGPVSFTAEHPFLFFIVDAQTSVALIAGRIDDPLNSRIL